VVVVEEEFLVKALATLAELVKKAAIVILSALLL
jgi:hypothetical protein